MSNSPGRQESRKKVLVNAAVQGRTVGLMALFVVLTAILFLVGQNVGGGLSLWYVSAGLIAAILTLLIGVIYVGLHFSQHIVGPIYAIARTLEQIRNGDYSTPLKLRRHDQFQNLSSAFNLTLEVLRNRSREDAALFDELSARIESAAGIDQADRKALLERMATARAGKESQFTQPPLIGGGRGVP